ASEHDVKSIGKKIVRPACDHIQWRDQPVEAGSIPDCSSDRTQIDKRIAFKIHLGDQSLSKAVAEYGEVYMHRPPVIGAIWPGIGARADGQELIRAVLVRERSTATAKIGVERCQITILAVSVAACRIRLPDFDQRVPDRASMLI